MKKLLFMLTILSLTSAPFLGVNFSHKVLNHNQVTNHSENINSVYGYKNFVYAGSAQGLFESTDNGKTFSLNKAMPFSGGGIESINAYKNVLYVGNENGLYESTDNGKKFVRNKLIISSIKSIYGADNTIYVASWQGLFASKDDGKSFAQLAAKTFKQPILTTYVYHHVVYVGEAEEAGLYTSTNQGQTFVKKI